MIFIFENLWGCKKHQPQGQTPTFWDLLYTLRPRDNKQLPSPKGMLKAKPGARGSCQVNGMSGAQAIGLFSVCFAFFDIDLIFLIGIREKVYKSVEPYPNMNWICHWKTLGMQNLLHHSWSEIVNKRRSIAMLHQFCVEKLMTPRLALSGFHGKPWPFLAKLFKQNPNGYRFRML